MSRTKTTRLLFACLPPFLTILIVSLAAAQKAPIFTTIDFPGAVETAAYDISAFGNVVGTFTAANGVMHGFQETGGVFLTLNFPGATATMAYGTDDNGTTIVGSYLDSTNTAHAFKFHGGVFTTIDPPGSTYAIAWSIGYGGHVVGTYTDANGKFHAFLDETAFDAPNGAISTAFTGAEDSESSNYAGTYVDAGGVEHGFFLHRQEGRHLDFTDITVPGPDVVLTAVNRINDNEESVGFFGTDTAGPFTGFRRSGRGKFHRVSFPGAIDTRCLGVDNTGVIVGQYTDTAGVVHGFQMTP